MLTRVHFRKLGIIDPEGLHSLVLTVKHDDLDATLAAWSEFARLGSGEDPARWRIEAHWPLDSVLPGPAAALVDRPPGEEHCSA
jgi:hypothetical protein